MRTRSSESDRQGFTLIELMIVVVIIGILAALALPRFNFAATKAREKEAMTLLKQIHSLQEVYRADFGHYAATVDDLRVVGWQPPTGLQFYGLPEVIAGGGTGSTTYTACMTATSAGVDNISIDESNDYSTC
jgi:prepilin-type N-terminal cleavage/methylation domain-containing protein